ncbi:phosphatidylinositol 4-kinase-like protein PIK1 [Viridothelium virens]|uniref:1-phosphatidylinositol 4-kinase n=1 Tax=Viridothelium virens TaxID=1048519 RepID=A0A6A6H489_VIRVR|nr:phosphatidylinositol 4-kinase-like protein PIK1 [Viridothelium virens]
MSWNLLERFIESDHFSNDSSLAISYLARYAGANHVGIHYVLCSKLREFSYEEIEFLLPQLCHLLISIDNESMALEEFIIDLCEESVNAALQTFWLFQTYLHDLSGNPQSTSFNTCRRIYNKVQRIVFGASDGPHREKIQENVLPVTILSSIILAGVAAPFLPKHAGPLAIAQARKPRPRDDALPDGVEEQTGQRIQRSHTVGGGSTRPKRAKPKPYQFDGATSEITKSAVTRGQNNKVKAVASSEVYKRSRSSSPHGDNRNSTPAILAIPRRPIERLIQSASTASLPEKGNPMISPVPSPPPTATLPRRPTHDQVPMRRHSHAPRPLTPSALTRQQKMRMLRANYYRSETQLLTALEDISNRLVIVPKPARLSALRAELALIAQDLPAEVDIPVICPSSLEDGAAGRSKHHRIVRLNPAEATSLNSAERVPYLLMIEVLRDDFDFDADSDANMHLLQKLMAEKGTTRRRLFDLGDSSRETPIEEPIVVQGSDSVFEPANGDLASPSLLKDLSEDESATIGPKIKIDPNGAGLKAPPRLSSGASTISSSATLSTPRTSDAPSSRASSPGIRKMTLPSQNRPNGPDQPDFSALATHMRTAAQMLAQLEVSGSKRPKVELAEIKAKIIASMQNLEEQSFTEDPAHAPTFDTIMAKTTSAVTAAEVTADYVDDGIATPLDPNSSSGAGLARMENDSKTGGVPRSPSASDRDDPSAATFGEEWAAKKERIRKSSPYGWMKKWDLISVIVKTGADLRQEAFACQLIGVCARLWAEARVDVWVKRMRILVTGESSGLIETITNGVSLHSLKRSLTLSTIAAGANPRRRIASLKDHFLRTFGEVEGPAYRAGVECFAKSLAAYSVISWILQLKDRHNGNLLIDNQGHIIHIDFGFMLSNSPGSMGFEAAPFKLTHEYVDVLQSVPGGEHWDLYKQLCKEAFQALRKNAESIVMLVEVMGRESRMPCFSGMGVQAVVTGLRSRFRLELSKEEAEGFVESDLIGKSLGSYYTRLYDTFQYRTQGIY